MVYDFAAFLFSSPPLEGEQNDIYFSHFARICRRHERMGIRNDYVMIVITGKFKKKMVTIIFYIL